MGDLEGLWGDEFVMPKEKEKVKQVKEKIEKPKKPKTEKEVAEKQVKSKKISLAEKLDIIKTEVLRVLGNQKENVIVIRDKESLHKYIDEAISAGRLAVDTETNNSLDPITCKLMGPCFYYPGGKQAYVPINHRDSETKERLSWQLTEQDIADELSRFIKMRELNYKGNWKPDYEGQTFEEWRVKNNADNNPKPYIVMHNGKFDYQVIKCTCGIEVPIDWDTMIAAKLLDENELSAGLKQQYIEKINPDQEKYSIDKLFEGVEYADVDPDIFALYAATDSMMTDQLYEWQMNKFKNSDLSGVLNLAYKVEMPLVKVIGEMELNGMMVDQEYAERLSKKFHKQLDEIDNTIAVKLNALRPKIEAWRLTPEANAKSLKLKKGEQPIVSGPGYIGPDPSSESAKVDVYGKSKSEQLADPINLGSPTQLAILFYDILKAPVVDKKQPRATGEDALKAIGEKLSLPLCDLLLKRRENVKLLTTYIDSIPNLALRWPDGRVRTHFNQYGAATGRLSSSDPLNFQNIPSHSKLIRKLFCAAPGNKIIGADFSAQEPRLTAHYSGDENMIKAYCEGKDLYSVIASMSFDYPYEECLEFYPEGTKIIYEGKEVICGKKTHQNKDGKERRNNAKAVLLGLEYGRGAASIAEQLGKTKEEAQDIIDKFFTSFPAVKKWIDESIENSHKYGYVEDIAGRRRRLPDAQLKKYEIKFVNPSRQALGDFNPFIGCSDRVDQSSNKILAKYNKKCDEIKFAKDYEKLKEDALKEGVEIHSNTGFIAQAERQAVNSRVQGGAATLTKSALIDIFYDQKLRELNAKLINTVHDEILVEAPETNSEEVSVRLPAVMVEAAKKFVTSVPMACDPYVVKAWYDDEVEVLLQKEFKKELEKNSDSLAIFEIMAENHQELTRKDLYEFIKGNLKEIPKNLE